MTTPKERLNLVKGYGMLTQVDGKWIFRAEPGKGCPVLEMGDVSRWKVIETVYYAILDYKKEK